MKKEIIKTLTNNFESSAKHTENGIEFWLARDLQKLLEYSEWRNFSKVITKARISCKTAEQSPSEHFVDVNKTIEMPQKAKKEVNDTMLTRYACYLIAQNGDPKKEKIAFAQAYFALQTRKLEIIEKRLTEIERLSARKKLATTEKELSKIIFEKTRNNKNFGLIRSQGDKALFGYSTQQMKEKWRIPKSRSLADFAATIILKAKDFASEITIFNVKEKQLRSKSALSKEHIVNNKAVRNTLLKRGIKPENLPSEEDIKKVFRRISSESKKELKNPAKLEN